VVSKADVEKGLRLISQAWGRKQSGYVFFPWIDRDEQKRSGKRRAGFHEGPSFFWPTEKEAIVNHLLAHTQHDLYWTASLYEFPYRGEEVAMDEHALWADLDEVDPSTLDEYPPTIAWESSPGRYQALWVAGQGDFQGASWPGNENQQMTYMIGADPSGWDTVQLLRIPGWENHKPEYEREDGTYPQGKILWDNGPKYLPGDFADLPKVQIGADNQLTDALATDIDGVDRLQVIANVRIKLNHTARDLLNATEAHGDKSDNLWYLTRCLADAGLSTAEIVAVVRDTVWNKFRDRHDELRRLISEASKAIAKRSDETVAALDKEQEEADVERQSPQRLGFLLKNIKKPKYLVQGILTEGACGFIAGEPKSYKSWVGLDLALSVATGADFLGHFRVHNPGPVLYIQEEDPATTLKNRSAKIWVSKSTDKFELVHNENEAGLYWLPPEQDETFDPEINAMIQAGVILSNEAWQLHLDDVLTKGMDGEPYRLMIIDTLMMTAGEVDENRSQEMTTKIFKPLKTLSRKHGVAVLVVHHMGKSEKTRPGQRMLGAVANHAWAEDSIYLGRSGMKDIRIDLESKTVPASTWRMTDVHNLAWTPQIAPWSSEDETQAQEDGSTSYSGGSAGSTPKSRRKKPATNDGEAQLLAQFKGSTSEGLSTGQLADKLKLNRSTVHRQMTRLLDKEKVERHVIESGSNAGSNVWTLKA
jgi:hypothetical protein